MALTLRCPNCSKALTAPEQLIGKRVKCPNCGGRVDIIDLDAIDVDEAPPDDDPAAQSTIAYANQRKTSPGLAAAIPAPPPRPPTVADPASTSRTAAEKAPQSRRLAGWISWPVVICSAVGAIVGYLVGVWFG